ncbi:hypothetical protein BGW38_004381, partial [Lunasporangiospora selenospora]
MAKRPSAQALAQPPQKPRRTTETLKDYYSESFDDAVLTTTLATVIFGDRPQKVELNVVDYLRNLRSQPVLAPSIEGNLAYFVDVLNVAPGTSVVRTWSRMKQYFGDTNKEDHILLEDMIGVDVLATTYRDSPEMDALECDKSLADFYATTTTTAT